MFTREGDIYPPLSNWNVDTGVVALFKHMHMQAPTHSPPRTHTQPVTFSIAHKHYLV